MNCEKRVSLIKRLVCPAKDSSSVRDISPEDVSLIKWIAKTTGMKYNELGDKCFLDPDVIRGKGPAPEGGVVYPSGVMLPRSPDNNLVKYMPSRPDKATPLVRAPYDSKLSANFTLGEFACHDRQTYPDVRVHPNLVLLLEKIRKIAGGKAIHITSGYRPPAYNLSVGGEPNSLHIDGMAADIYIDGVSTSALADICDQAVGATGGVGYYPYQGFVHVDVRGYLSRWDG